LKSPRLQLLFFILLSLATFCSGTYIIQHRDISQQLLSNADFSDGLNKWEFNKDVAASIVVQKNTIALNSPGTTTSVKLYQTVTEPMGGKTVRLCALLRTKEVIKGEKTWNKARLLLVQYSNGKSLQNVPHKVASLDGTQDWQEVNQTFTIEPNCTEFKVILLLSRCSGTLFVKNLRLHQVEDTLSYTWTRRLLGIAWPFFVLLLLFPYLKTGRPLISKLPVLITVTVILIGTAMPGTIKNDIKKKIASEFTADTNRSSITVFPAQKGCNLQPDWLSSAVKHMDITVISALKTCKNSG
jgi:hypothetical protein